MNNNKVYPVIIKISNKYLELSFDSEKSVFSVYDKRVGKKWEYLSFKQDFRIENINYGKDFIILFLNGQMELKITVELQESAEVVFTIDSNIDNKIEKFQFPKSIITPDKNHYLVLTDSEGILLPVDDVTYPLENKPFYYCEGGLCMSWIGMTDKSFNSGYMAIFETPFDCEVNYEHIDGSITFSPIWLSSMGIFNYPRKIRYIFFDKGGYVAQCKKYKEYIWEKNNVKTLKENEKRFPAINKILGGVHIYVWDNARSVKFAKELKNSGIDKALILWDPNHAPYPKEKYDSKLKKLEYGTGAYELFTDIHPDNYPGNKEIEKLPLKRNVFPKLFDIITAKKKDGSTYSNEFGTYICPAAVTNEIIKRVEKELKIYPHETYFLDVYQANGLYECYDNNHKLTRAQYAEAILNNYKLLEDKYNVYLGGEFGSDFVGSHGIYVHGMMTLQRTWFRTEADIKGTIYYKGNWKNNRKPSIMVGTRTASNIYNNYSVNEVLRAPLYELVYHDAIITSWRWDDCNHHCPEIWWKKDLFNILYGSAPLWSLDKNRWEAYKYTFIDSYKKVCGIIKEICYDELVEHRFVSDDHKIQESVFSSGKKIVVNFSDLPYEYEKYIIEPRGYIFI